MTLRGTRRLLYRGARLLGDVQGVQRGPSGVARRAVRRSAYRGSSRVTRRLLRMFGL